MLPATFLRPGTPPTTRDHRALLAGTTALTPRENEVLHWLCEGKANAEIAIILAATPRTVAAHVAAILRKLGVETRLVALAAIRHAEEDLHFELIEALAIPLPPLRKKCRR